MPLVRRPPPAAAATLDAGAAVAALRHGSVDERWAAARALPPMPGAVGWLTEALGAEADSRVQEAIATRLAAIGTGEAIEAMLPFLRSDDAQLRTCVLDALLTVKHAIAAYLPALLRDPDGDVRVLACGLARNLPDDEAARLLCEMLDAETEPNACAAAVEVLAEVGSAAALPTLERCAERFRATPFIAFSIDETADRIRAEAMHPRE